MQVVELDGSHWIHVDQPEGVFKTMYIPSNFISVWLIQVEIRAGVTEIERRNNPRGNMGRVLQVGTCPYAWSFNLKRRGILTHGPTCLPKPGATTR